MEYSFLTQQFENSKGYYINESCHRHVSKKKKAAVSILEDAYNCLSYFYMETTV